MKSIYLVFLILSVSCLTKNDFFDSFQCLIKNEKIMKEVNNVIQVFKTKNFNDILSILLNAYLNIKEDVLKCFEPTLKGGPFCKECLEACHGDKKCQVACFLTIMN